MRANGVRAGYRGTPVVDDASVRLAAGRVTALIGPNGSGKSTLLRTMAALHPAMAGRIELADGAAVRELSPRELARRVTLLSQARPTPGGVTVREVVAYGRHPHRPRWGPGDAEGPEVVQRVMEMTGVTGLADRPVDSLSGGQLQRVWLAGCLAQDTPVLLLDEPTTFLDLRYQVELLDIVRDLADREGIAVGLVLHDLDQAAAVADDIVLLVDGRIAAAGPPETVMTPALLTTAYGIDVDVHRDPGSGLIHTRARARHHGRHGTATA
ncbi:ABC transporter ATP-binding protein [Streptomyces marincola]|uniref:Iron-dicitrate transporter ATP-binding subunit n=1 Tax=Streptomyces marincola TaxID=2878388 RepID=A0A1W7CVE0_9ACTN|nr:ABC transporter ATP-binding protein [Streptomyces marincola]ARQ68793.1 iron-dicitrate transporter ATP-binding subunit [Streptomyces marincola]